MLVDDGSVPVATGQVWPFLNKNMGVYSPLFSKKKALPKKENCLIISQFKTLVKEIFSIFTLSR